MFVGGVDTTLTWNVCRCCGHDFDMECLQVVWDETREVGCAYKTCDTIVGSFITAGTYLVCNYGPA